MKSSLIFLGTAGDSFLTGRAERSSAGFLLKYHDHQFHVDPGVSPVMSAKEAGADLRSTNAIFVTRNNFHHASGLNETIDAMTFGGFDHKGVLVAQEDVINGTDTTPSFLHPSAKNQVERYITLKDGSRVGIHDIEVQGLKTTIKSSIGLKIFTPTFTIGYSGDTKYSLQVASQFKGVSILILNVPHTEKGSQNQGLSIEDAIKIVNVAKPNVVIVTSFDAHFVREDPVYQVRAIQRETGVQCIAAKDGLIIDPESYSANLGQQTLSALKQGVDMTLQESEDPEKQISEKPDEVQQTLAEEDPEEQPDREGQEQSEQESEQKSQEESTESDPQETQSDSEEKKYTFHI